MSLWQPRADLHAHSRCSDGTMTPEEVIRQADLAGLDVFSLTDHDTVAGIQPALDEIARLESPLELLTGAELTCYDAAGREWHMLAYGFDHRNPRVTGFLEARVREREARIHRILEKLAAAGAPLQLGDVLAISRGGVIGRLHVAKALLDKGYCLNVPAAFQRYLVEGAPAYVPKPVITPEAMVVEVHAWGAAAVLAHPVQFKAPEELDAALECGVDGVEAYHPSVDKSLRKTLKKLARQRGLVVTGGGDSHGQGYNRPQIGEVTVPAHFVAALKERIARHAGGKSA